MHKTTVGLAGVIAGLLIAPFVASAQNTRGTSYGEERALIENLQARYLFALDFKDTISTSLPSLRTVLALYEALAATPQAR